MEEAAPAADAAAAAAAAAARRDEDGELRSVGCCCGLLSEEEEGEVGLAPTSLSLSSSARPRRRGCTPSADNRPAKRKKGS